MNEKMTISLPKKQRDLLLKYKPYFTDKDIFRTISIAIKKGNNYEIYLDKEQRESLIDQIAELSNGAEDEKAQSKLDGICDYLQGFSDTLEEDEKHEEYSKATGFVCILKVALADSKKIWRKIAIRQGQTLHDLHNIIFDAFEREEEHLYSFFFPFSAGKLNPRKIHKSSDEYTHPDALEDAGMYSREIQDASKTMLGSLKIIEGQVFYYLFDFGDEWWHEITIEKTGGAADNGKYPRIIEKKGKSPEQYGFPGEEEDFEN